MIQPLSLKLKHKLGHYAEYTVPKMHHGIEAIWSYQVPFEDRLPSKHTVVAEPSVNIVFSRNKQATHAYSRELLQLFGPVHTPRDFTAKSGMEMFAVRLHPELVRPLFSIRPSDLTDKIVSLEAVALQLNENLLKKIKQREPETSILSQLLGGLEEFMETKFMPNLSEQALQFIRQRKGQICMNALSGKLGWSTRHIRRVVLDETGYSPKEYARIIRFHNTLAFMDKNRKINWPDTAVHFGYYDQAHMIKEFQTFSFKTPLKLRQARLAESVISNIS